MKREIGSYIAKCDICQRVKAGHQRPAGLLQPLQIPEWKWDSVGMDFITGLPTSSRGNDSIWVIVDRLSKVAHFLPVKTTYQSSKLAELYIARIVSLHGVPKNIVSESRNSVYLEILEESPRRFRNPPRFQYRVSPSDRWTNGASKPNTRRYA